MKTVSAASRRSMRRLLRWVVGLCLVLGFLVRALAGWHAYFADDESLFWATGVQLVRGEAFPLVGPPVSGSPAGLPGPLFYWVCALPALVSSHPYAQSLFYAAFAQLGVLLFASVLRRWWGLRAAGVFLVVSVAAPWLVAYADRVWAGNLFFTLCALVVWLTSRLASRPGRRAEAFALGALAIAMPQLHLSTVHLTIMAAAALLVLRRRPPFAWLALGAVLGALFYVPYLVHELRTDFSNTNALRAHAAGVPLRSASALVSLYASFLGLATTDLSYLFVRGFWGSFNQVDFWRGSGIETMSQVYAAAGSRALLWFAHGLTWALQLIGVVTLVASAVRRRKADLLTLLLGIALADITLLYVLSGKSGHVHYTTVVLPLALLPTVAALRALPRRVFRPLVPGLALAFFAASGLLLTQYYRHTEGTIADQLAIVRRVHQERGARPFAFIPGSQWIFQSAYLRLSVLLERQPWEPSPAAAPADTFVVMTRADWEQRNTGDLSHLERLVHLVLARPAR